MDVARMTAVTDEAPWWQRAVVYQIYPRSFADSDGDGVGDLPGLHQRLDHLQWLGVDALWLSPIFRSPMADYGYDVADYCDIDPLFGTLADAEALVAACHERDIRVLLDWVPNHTSDQHPWFLDSRSSRQAAKRDWYIWRDSAPDGGPPNNWRAAFDRTQPAWTRDEATGQWYLHEFLPDQPDLDWSNPDVRAAMLDTLRFWLDRGVDGFRMDVIHLLGKDLADDPPEMVAAGVPHVPLNDVPSTHDHLRLIRGVLDEYDGDRTSVGEVYLLDEAAMATYYGEPAAGRPELHLSFNFSFLWSAFDADVLRRRITTTLGHLVPRGAWPTWALSNHDVPRHRTRYGGTEAAARAAATMVLTLPGTPFLYQGEELGLLDADIPPERVVDPGGRDGCRAPIPWDATPGHGWPDTAWLPLAPEADERNPDTLRSEPDSILHLYRRLLAARREHRALSLGGFSWLDGPDEVLAYRRTHPDGDAVALVSTAAHEVDISALVGDLPRCRVVVATSAGWEGEALPATLPPYGALVALVEGAG